ncbi:MAG: HNH endonuclease signature motif containing protein [Tissierellia bacterium]|nr:HNH endonuclease signature motif containing protein [Tissierellia bacterium]
MAKPYAKKFYKSKAWQRCRASFISYRESIDGGLCQHCQSKRGYIVDHVVEITPSNINDVTITLNHDNLQFLCLPCHNKKTFKKNFATKENLFFDEVGNIFQVPPKT